MVPQSSPVSPDIRDRSREGRGGAGRGEGGLLPLSLGPLVVLPNKKQTAIVAQLRGSPPAPTLPLFMEPPVNCGPSQLCPFSAL